MLTDGCSVATDGKTKSNHILSGMDGLPEHVDVFVPRVPKHIVNEFALKASATIDKIAEEAINMILPDDWKTIADQRLYTKTKGNTGFN